MIGSTFSQWFHDDLPSWCVAIPEDEGRCRTWRRQEALRSISRNARERMTDQDELECSDDTIVYYSMMDDCP